ncbi:hypothetical protein [Mycolicibacterium fortuitum]|uniref:hypothetical protein n=1 Tax=Mycolicibacterium fortuitum TaxID=1766 RepID=UPI0009700B9D|nr:hypothetical protein [Mycolicibacterium fortuitum]OMC07281.1 hypothetical protein A5734_03570 [Mycolicibacterium fortuitum]
MSRSSLITFALISAASAVSPVPVAHAGESVTYEVVSDNVASASNIEYFDGAARQLVENVPLPWRTTVAIANPRSLSTDGAEIRADWRSSIAAPVWQTGKWVTVRIYIGDTLRCQNTLDVGNAACYGSTGFQS